MRPVTVLEQFKRRVVFLYWYTEDHISYSNVGGTIYLFFFCLGVGKIVC